MSKQLESISEQAPPFTVQIEFVEGCNLACSFCGLRGMREKLKPWNFVTEETIERIASEVARVGWNAKIVIGMHGEPTLHPRFWDLVSILRKHLPKQKMHIFTNGYGIVNNYITKIVRNPDKIFLGLEEFKRYNLNICLDYYSDNGDWQPIAQTAIENDMNIVFLEKGVPLFNTKKDWRICVLPPIKDDGENNLTRNLANHAGAAGPLDHSFNNKRCTMPFRELSFRWDGNVALCCDDFRGQYPIENIHNVNIEELWNHPAFQAARLMLYNYDRTFKPCIGCTNLSMRVGFLPDPTGQDTLPEPTNGTKQYARNWAKEHKPLSKIVKRKWEK